MKKSPDQLTLFDMSPIKEDRVAIAQRNIEIAQRKSNTPVVYVIFYKNNIDVAHWSMPEDKVQSSYENYEKFEVMNPDTYWRRFHDNEFQTGRL